MSERGTSTRMLEWANRNLGTKEFSAKENRWNANAGFPPGTDWCGIFLGQGLLSQGIKPPSNYAAAVNWSSYGTKVGAANMRPGDIIVYGSEHVAMYAGNGQMFSGNFSDEVQLTPIERGFTAVRRPPWKSGGGNNGFSSFGPLGTLEEVVTAPSRGIASLVESGTDAAGDAVSSVGEEVVGYLGDLLGEKAVPILLNVGLVGGGAFLALFGIARMVGVSRPMELPTKVARTAGKAAVL